MINKIKSPKDVKKIPVDQLPNLCVEIRQALLQKISTHGGHLSPNLGVVELTTALHYVFDAPTDKIVFDVSHQTYVHKMLTGRAQAFTDSTHYHDVNGFSNPSESPYDLFTLGHTSTALSLACGLAKARDLLKQTHHVVAIIGDGSLSGGQAFEALNNIAEQGGNIVVIINDNAMSIAENHGGYYQNLEKLRATNGAAPDNFFRSLGLDYVYEPNGNDVQALIKTLTQVKDAPRPIVVHVHTVKGYGYAPATADPERFHFTAPFDLATGAPKVTNATAPNYTSITYDYLAQKMSQDACLVAISSATPKILGFNAERRQQAQGQFVDTGIAEEHAVAYAAGMAKGGAHPVYGVYGSFLQRSFDQLHQDLALDNNPATLLIFGDHVHGMAGSTHNGFYDIVELSHIPNLIYLAPISRQAYLQMLDWSIQQTQHSVAIRVPDQVIDDPLPTKKFSLNSRIITQGQDVAIIAVGSLFPMAQQVVTALQNHDIHPTLIDPVCLSSLDEKMLQKIAPQHRLVITLEEGILDGGFGQKVAAYFGDSNVKVHNFGFTTGLTQDFEPDDFLKQNGLTVDNITNYIVKHCHA